MARLPSRRQWLADRLGLALLAGLEGVASAVPALPKAAAVLGLGAGAVAGGPAAAAAAVRGDGAACSAMAPPALAASWLQDTRHFVGLLVPGQEQMCVQRAVALPSRAHAVIPQADGRVLVAARRPGDWLVRLDLRGEAEPQWCWSDGSTCFNGHVIPAADGRRLFTSETDLDTGEGLLGVYTADTLELIDRWPVGGIDPHQMIESPDGALWVAIGGIEIRQETGRVKHRVAEMASSLVRLDPRTGRVQQRWTLPDRLLGLRHLAASSDGRIGIALQAEHADPAQRASAPVLAVLDPAEGLHPVPLPAGIACAGYGGSIAAAGRRLFVSCPRVNRVMHWDGARSAGRPAGSGWLPPIDLAGAYPVAAEPAARPGQPAAGRVWIGGDGLVLASLPAGVPAGQALERLQLDPARRLDNHWSMMP